MTLAHRVPLAGPGRARAQAAGPPEAAGLSLAAAPPLDRFAHADAAGHLAAVGLDQRGRPAGRRRPARDRRGALGRGAARPGLHPRGPRRAGAEDPAGRVQRLADDAQGSDASARRRRVPRGAAATVRGGAARAGDALLAIPGDRRRLRRRRRLPARARPARRRRGRPSPRAGRPSRGAATPGDQPGAALGVHDAAGGHPPGGRRRRVRRHRRHRHPRGPRRGAGRRHPRRVRRRAGRALRRRRGRRVDGALRLEDFAEQTGIDLADGAYETVAGFVIARLGRIPDVGDVVDTGRGGGSR